MTTSYWPPLSRITSHVTANPSHKTTVCKPSLATFFRPPLRAIGPLGEEIHPAAAVHCLSLSLSLTRQHSAQLGGRYSLKAAPTANVSSDCSQYAALPQRGHSCCGLRNKLHPHIYRQEGGAGRLEHLGLWVMFCFFFHIAPRTLHP